MLHFCYIFKNVGDTFEIENSIRIVKQLYPEAEITVIGDKVKGVNHIKYNHRQFSNRASRVSDMLLKLADNFDEFILMYDDIFFSRKVDIVNYTCGELKGKKNRAYNLCIQNTIDFLRYFNKPILSYDAHQPFLFNSNKLKELYKLVDNKQPHLPKSLYGNYYELESVDISNLKVASYKKALLRLDEHGMFSSTDSMCERTKKLIKELPFQSN